MYTTVSTALIQKDSANFDNNKRARELSKTSSPIARRYTILMRRMRTCKLLCNAVILAKNVKIA